MTRDAAPELPATPTKPPRGHAGERTISPAYCWACTVARPSHNLDHDDGDVVGLFGQPDEPTHVPQDLLGELLSVQ